MTTYRKARPEDRAQYLDFINMVFSMAHRPHDFSKLLPKVYGPGRPTDALQNIAVDEAGRVRGLVAVLPGELRVGDKVLRTGYVGSVSAHPFARGEGHMKALMKMAIEGAAADGADLMMLGGQRQRYEYFGFTPGGVEIRYTVDNANLRHALRGVDIAPYTFVSMQEADAALVDQAFALHEAQPVHMQRSREDFVVILESWLSKPHIVLKDGAFAGYLTASGDDKSFLEILLCDEALYGPVVKAWMEQRGVRGLEIPAAAYNLALNRVLSSFAEIAEIGMGQLLRVLNFPKVVAALLPLSGAVQPLADGALSLWIDGKPQTIAVKGGEASVTEEAPEAAPHLTALTAQNLLFSPLGAYLGISAPAGWLPLLLYMHSPDNF